MITAFIPARSSDHLLKNKNILPFGNSDLLTHKIQQLRHSARIKEIVVSSECSNIGDLAQRAGAKFVKRPVELSNLNADFNSLCEYAASIINDEHILWAPVTCPLITPLVFGECISHYFSSIEKGYDSLITVNKIKRFLLDENGPLNFRFVKSNRSSAKLPVLYEFVNAVCICKKSDMKKWRYNWGKIPYKFELPVHMQVDICDEFDYRLSKMIYGDQHEVYN